MIYLTLTTWWSWSVPGASFAVPVEFLLHWASYRLLTLPSVELIAKWNQPCQIIFKPISEVWLMTMSTDWWNNQSYSFLFNFSYSNEWWHSLTAQVTPSLPSLPIHIFPLFIEVDPAHLYALLRTTHNITKSRNLLPMLCIFTRSWGDD